MCATRCGSARPSPRPAPTTAPSSKSARIRCSPTPSPTPWDALHHHSIGTLQRDTHETLDFPHQPQRHSHRAATRTEHPPEPHPAIPTTPWHHTQHWISHQEEGGRGRYLPRGPALCSASTSRSPPHRPYICGRRGLTPRPSHIRVAIEFMVWKWSRYLFSYRHFRQRHPNVVHRSCVTSDSSIRSSSTSRG